MNKKVTCKNKFFAYTIKAFNSHLIREKKLSKKENDYRNIKQEVIPQSIVYLGIILDSQFLKILIKLDFMKKTSLLSILNYIVKDIKASIKINTFLKIARVLTYLL